MHDAMQSQQTNFTKTSCKYCTICTWHHAKMTGIIQ
nr:MAG TPA: zinc finger protein [Caudoviricetes sp.]